MGVQMVHSFKSEIANKLDMSSSLVSNNKPFSELQVTFVWQRHDLKTSTAIIFDPALKMDSTLHCKITP